MKIRSILFTTLCSLMLGAIFANCSDSEDEPEPIIDPVDNPVYILNEGGSGDNYVNTANISRFFPSYNIPTESDYYKQVNGKGLGDVANAIIREDNNIYVVLFGSKYIAKLNLKCEEENRYTFPEIEGAPRYIDMEGEYAYITQYGGQISKLNAKDMTLVSTFHEGNNLEGIVEKDGKLYVANSWKSINDFNKEIIVIDAKTMTKVNTINVELNPVQVQEINNKIYVISQGNYADVPAVLQVINTQTNTSKTILKDVDKITEGHNGLIYGVRSTFDANWTPINSFFIYNPTTDEVNETSFLQDAPSSFSSDAIYLLEVDEKTGFIYVGTTDYTTNGTIYQFDKSGKFLQSFDSGGINPSTMIFID